MAVAQLESATAADAEPIQSPFKKTGNAAPVIREELHNWQVEQTTENDSNNCTTTVYDSESKADAAARLILQEDRAARVFVAGPKGRRYRVLP